jgi:hypothetical protein
MSVFSFVFTALFLSFVVAAVVGHVLLVGALLRPFLAKLPLAPMPARDRVLTVR